MFPCAGGQPAYRAMPNGRAPWPHGAEQPDRQGGGESPGQPIRPAGPTDPAMTTVMALLCTLAVIDDDIEQMLNEVTSDWA